jgi:hypothetical protein
MPHLSMAAPAAAPAHDTTSQATTHGRHSKRHAAPAPTPRAQRRRGAHHDHPLPRIIVDVTHVDGTAQKADIQRTAREKGWGVIKSCYEEGLRRNQRLAGQVSFELTVGDDGTVSDPRRLDQSITDESVNLCVSREVAKIQLFKPENAKAIVAFQVTLSPGDDAVPMPKPLLRSDRITETLRSRWSGVEVCYREGLDRDRTIGGRLEVKMRVRPSGEVADASEGETHFMDSDVSRCVVELFKNTKFRKLAGRKDESFTYALHLEASPQEASTTDTRDDNEQ